MTGTLQIHSLPDSVNSLPVMALADDIANALSESDVLLRAEPGAGKSTGLPLALLVNGKLNGQIIMLEPRRLAARSVANRLAAHLGETVGQRIGLRMRADTRVSKDTQLTVVTEGVLTRLLQDDPSLDGVALVIFDEFHERSLHADLGLALCLEVQQALREDLRLLLMSATLDAEQLNAELKSVQQFHCSVRQHPVHTIWAGKHTGSLEQHVVNTISTAVNDHEGDVLVFLPGVAEINRTAKQLQPRLQPQTQLHTLHSGVSLDAQIKATAPASTTGRRVILSTSLAETSVTIDGVRIVIDSGLERRGRIDASTGAQKLETVSASQASATQRTGRAGRTTSGVCYRLWNESGHTRRAAHWQPEIHRADLAPLLMELGLWGASGPNELTWLDPPSSASIARAEDLLSRFNLWQQGQLTSHGRAVGALPVHPRIGHMLIWAAEHNAAHLACRLAVQLDDQSRRSGSADLEPDLKSKPTSQHQRRASQLEQLLNTDKTQGNPMSAAVLLAQAYPDWIAQRRPGGPGNFRLASGAGVALSPEDALAHSQWLAVAELGGSGSQLRIFKALELDIEELELNSPELFSTINHVDWDNKQQRVLAERRVMLEQLIVQARPLEKINSTDRAIGLTNGVRRIGLHCLPWTEECREWQARVTLMQNLSTSEQPKEWPIVDDDALNKSLEEWLLPWLDGFSSIKALQQLNLQKALNAMLDYQQQILLDEWLPKRYRVPSGSQIALSYLQPGNPVLSVKLQEMLGCAENPSIAKGQIPLKVELLSPAKRPVQVTTDLKNFWHNSYPAVKKEMAGRYPKHTWPDDPMNAEPTTRTRKR